MWTQEQDDILIENYQQFNSLPKKERYMVLSELVGSGKSYQDCYKRAKALKLKKADKEVSKAISCKLLGANKAVSEQVKNIKNKLVGDALKRLCLHTAKKQALTFE